MKRGNIWIAVLLFCGVGQVEVSRGEQVPAQGGPPTILWGVEPSYTRPPAPEPTDSELAAAAASGIRWIQTYGGVKIGNRDDSVTVFLARVRAAGFSVLASLEHIDHGQIDTAFLARKISRWKDDSAIGAWELVDEPEMKGVSPRDLANAYALCKRLDPLRPVVVVWAPVSQHNGFERFGRTFDWGAVDIYPIARAGFDTLMIPRAVRQLREAFAFGERPLTPVVQAFGDVRHALPSPVELRRMVNQFRTAGADYGVAFYAWNSTGAAANLGTTALWPALLGWR